MGITFFFASDNGTRCLAIAISLVGMMLAWCIACFHTILALVEIGNFGLAIFPTYEGEVQMYEARRDRGVPSVKEGKVTFFVTSAAPGLDLHFGGDSTLLPPSIKMSEEGYYLHHGVARPGAAAETTKNAILSCCGATHAVVNLP